MNADTVLCVDDEPNILQSLKRLLRGESYTLQTASTPDEALNYLDRHDVQLVISDQRMPHMSGTELLQLVKQRYPEVVRVILSGYSDLQTVIDAVNMGQISRFMAKPWNDEDMKLTIRQCLEQYRLAESNRRLAEQVKTQNETLQRLNNQLNTVLAERTRVLATSQDIVDTVPLPLIGIGADRIVVFTNSALMRSSLEFRALALGDDIATALPADLREAVETCLASAAPVRCSTAGGAARYRIEPLGKGADLRGCLVMCFGAESS